MKKKFLVSLVALVITVFCSSGYAAPKGTLRAAVSTFSYESMDPIFWESMWGWAMYDPLLSFDAKGNVIGVVAKSWKLSPDGLTWTFKIRKGIKFHNGDPLTAEDVAFSVTRFASKESKNPWSPYLRNNFESVEVPDPYTFVYHAKRPEPPLVVPFGWTRILPKKYIEKVGIEKFKKHPIGSGPWKFVKLVSKTSMEMAAVHNHWRQTPAFEHYIEYLVPEESTRVAMLKRGDVDIAMDISFDRIVELQKEKFRLQEIGLKTLVNFSFQGTWLTEGPTKYKQFRQAMSYAINRQELSETYYHGFAKPGGRWFMEERTWGWDPNWKADPYDPAKVKSLLKEIGYPDKFADPVVQIYTQQPWADLTQAIAGYWDDAGIQTKINVLDPMGFGGLMFVRLKDKSAKNVGDAIFWIWPAFFNNVYHSANMFKSTGVHSTGNDPKADKMYDAVVREMDPVKAKKMWTEFMDYAYNMWVNVGVVSLPSYAVVGPKVGEFKNNAFMSLWDSLAWIQHKK